MPVPPSSEFSAYSLQVETSSKAPESTPFLDNMDLIRPTGDLTLALSVSINQVWKPSAPEIMDLHLSSSPPWAMWFNKQQMAFFWSPLHILTKLSEISSKFSYCLSLSETSVLISSSNFSAMTDLATSTALWNGNVPKL